MISPVIRAGARRRIASAADRWFRSHLLHLIIPAFLLLGSSCRASLLDLLGSSNDRDTSTQLQRAYAEAAYDQAQGKTLTAIEAYSRCVELQPESVFFRLRLAEACLNANAPDKAEKAIEPVMESESPTPEVLRLQARIAVQKQEYDQAVALFERSLDEQPTNLTALQALIVLYYEHQHDMEKTKEISQRILRIDGGNLHALLYRAEACALTGDIDTAAEMFGRILRHHPTFIDRLDDLAQRLVQRDRKDDALLLYRKGVLMMPSAELLRRGFESLAGDGGTTATLEAYRSLAEEAPADVEILRLYAQQLLEADQFPLAEAQYRKILDVQPNDVGSHIALAEIALEQGRIEEALARFDEAIRRHPTDPEVYATVARLYLIRGDLPKSEQLLRDALVFGENNPTVRVLLADVCERAGRIDEAEAHLKRALDAMPANATLLGLLAGFYARNNRPAESAEVLEQILAVRPRDLSVYNQLVRYYLRNDRENAMRLLLSRGRKVFEDSVDFDLLIGQIAFQEDHMDLAKDSLERVIASQPANLDARILLANLHLALGNGEQAVKTLDEAGRLLNDRDDQYAWSIALGEIHMSLRQWDKAIERFKQAHALNPEEFSVYPGLVESLIRAGKTDEAIETLNGAVRQFNVSKPKEVQMLRASALMTQKNYDRARSILEGLAKDYADDSEVLFTTAALYGETGDLEKAEATYRKVIELNPDNAVAYNNLGYLFAEKNIRLDEAETLVKKALELQPGAGYILDSLGWVYYQKGDLDRAVEYLEKALTRTIGDPEVYEHLGDAYKKRGNRDAALDHYRKSLALDPEREGVGAKITELTVETPSPR